MPASAERLSSHPLGRSMARYSQKGKVSAPWLRPNPRSHPDSSRKYSRA